MLDTTGRWAVFATEPARPLKRHRGYILSEAGRHKLQVQLSKLEFQKSYRFTLQVLARQTQLVDLQGLHSTTIKKIVEHQIGVDERSIETFLETIAAICVLVGLIKTLQLAVANRRRKVQLPYLKLRLRLIIKYYPLLSP